MDGVVADSQCFSLGLIFQAVSDTPGIDKSLGYHLLAQAVVGDPASDKSPSYQLLAQAVVDGPGSFCYPRQGMVFRPLVVRND